MKRPIRIFLVFCLVLALVSTAAYAAFRPATGGWGGETAQDLPIRFRVSGNGTVRKMKFQAKANCPLGEARFRVTFSGSANIRGRRFTFHGEDVLSEAHVKGRFIGRRHARGTLRWSTFDGSLGGICRSGLVSWRAKKF